MRGESIYRAMLNRRWELLAHRSGLLDKLFDKTITESETVDLAVVRAELDVVFDRLHPGFLNAAEVAVMQQRTVRLGPEGVQTVQMAHRSDPGKW